MANALQTGEPSTYMWVRQDLSQDVTKLNWNGHFRSFKVTAWFFFYIK